MREKFIVRNRSFTKKSLTFISGNPHGVIECADFHCNPPTQLEQDLAKEALYYRDIAEVIHMAHGDLKATDLHIALAYVFGAVANGEHPYAGYERFIKEEKPK